MKTRHFPTQNNEILKSAAPRSGRRHGDFGQHIVFEDPALTAQKAPTWTAQKPSVNPHMSPPNPKKSARRHADRGQGVSFEFMPAACSI
jgi:hypothetical protein